MNELLQQQVERFDPRTQKVLTLATALAEIPGITVPAGKTDFEALDRSHQLVKEFAQQNGLRTIEMAADVCHPYPYLIVAFQENDPASIRGFRADVALVGHIDVVGAQAPEQFTPKIEDDMLIGRGVADMKTVVASQLVWMAEQQAKTGPKPPIIVMVSSTEENGSTQPNGTQHAIAMMRNEFGAEVQLAIVGERTGEMESMGKVPVGPICDANRGWRWYRGEGPDVLQGSEALRFISEIVKSGRQEAVTGNAVSTSERMEKQGNWRSGFVNSFASIGPDANLEKFQDGTLIEIEIPGEAKHAATISASTPTVLERLATIFDKMEESLGNGNVAVESVAVGEDGNYNTVTGGGKIRLVIGPSQIHSMTLAGLIDQLQTDGLKVTSSAFDPSTIQARLPVFGLDIREIPEHTDSVNHWLAATRARLAALGFELETINEGDGWVCPPGNEYLQRLQTAYFGVIRQVSPRLGKLHGNDGRFFGGKAVVFGQTGIGPHGPNEAHYIPSIEKYLQILDEFAAGMVANMTTAPTATPST